MKNAYARPSYSTIALILDLLRYIRPYRVRFGFATLMRLFGDILRLYPAYATAQIVTELSQYSPDQSLTPIWWYIGTALCVYILHIICRQTAKQIGYKVAEKSALDVQEQAMEHLFLLDLSWHEKENSGNKLKRVLKGKEGIDQILRMWITNYIEIGVNFVGITIILFAFDPYISLAFLGYMVVYSLISLFFTRRASEAAHRVNVSEEELHGLSFESVNNIRSVKVLGMRHALLKRIYTKTASLFSLVRKRIFWFQTRYLAVDMFHVLFRFGMMVPIVIGVVYGRYDVGFFVLFMQYFMKISENIEELAMVTLQFVVAKYGVSRITDILDEPVHIDSNHGKTDFPDTWDKVHIENLSFSYDGVTPVLKDISFTINKGEKVGIVGVSGAGKSTLFKLLLKEHEGYDGTITIGNTRLKDIRRTDFFHHAAVVLQESEVFSFSLGDNIALGNPGETENMDLMNEVVAVSHVDDFLHKLPEGMNTTIGEKGVKLSGGEKQRVGIARALFKQPDILFMDEATSHLDTESEEKIQDSLHQFFQQVTAVVIAHRLSTIKEMDKIIVLEKGKIVEQGPFTELLKKRGRFFELWEKQKF